MKRCLFILAAILFLGNLQVSHAAVRLPAIIGDNMVLQQGLPDPIWGWADPGEKVTVALADQTQSAVADANGKWSVKLSPLSQIGSTVQVTITAANTIVLKNVLIGEVWVCSGQSNMGFTLSKASTAATEIPKANYPDIRLFTVKQCRALEPQDDCGGQWVVCSPDTVPQFTAVGYFFGKELHADLNRPIGLIFTAWGGTTGESWISLDGLQSAPQLAHYLPGVEKAEAALRAQTPQGAKLPTSLTSPPQQKWPGSPSVHYDGMIAPIIPFGIQGAIWYQGESNATRAIEYRTTLRTLITDWRSHWGQGDFSFLVVQLPNFGKDGKNSNWPLLREAQAMATDLPKTGIAATIDVGESGNLHPLDKADVGHRLALVAENMTYGKPVVASGPTFDSMEIQADKIRIHFKNIGGGLQLASHPATRPGAPPNDPGTTVREFTVAGDDQKFLPASAVIDGDTILVSSPDVKNPVAARYAWSESPSVNLYNKAGLPAMPFRTDKWDPAPPPAKPPLTATPHDSSPPATAPSHPDTPASTPAPG